MYQINFKSRGKMKKFITIIIALLFICGSGGNVYAKKSNGCHHGHRCHKHHSHNRRNHRHRCHKHHSHNRRNHTKNVIGKVDDRSWSNYARKLNIPSIKEHIKVDK